MFIVVYSCCMDLKNPNIFFLIMIQVNTKNITNIDNRQQLERQKTHTKYESLRHNKLKKVFKTITTTNTI